MTKKRLTITLSASTLKKVDELIDEKKVRSRSHAIETILQKQLEPSINTAVILAGGRRKTDESIKPLINFRGKPLIIHTIEHLKRYQIDNILVLADKGMEEVRETADNHFPKLNIKYIFEKKRLGTAGALKNAREHLKSSFFCLHADIFTDINLQLMANFHRQNQAIATIAVQPKMSHHSFDNVYIQGNKVVNFKPKDNGLSVNLVNSGIYLFEPELLDYIPNKTPTMLEKNVFPKVAVTQRIHAYTFQGIWFDVTTEQKYQEDIRAR